MARTRKSRSPEIPGYRKPLAFPTLVALVTAMVLFGVMHYSLLLAVGSAIFVGFFGWRWWLRTTAKSPARRRRTPSRQRRG